MRSEQAGRRGPGRRRTLSLVSLGLGIMSRHQTNWAFVVIQAEVDTLPNSYFNLFGGRSYLQLVC